MPDRLQGYIGLETVHKGFEEAAQQLSKHLGVPLCVESCGLCCINVPVAYELEVAYAYSSLLGKGFDEALSRAEGWLLDRSNLTIYEGVPVGIITGRLREDYDALHATQCPFLDRDKRCIVYEARPLPCRAYGVSRMPAPNCKRPLGKREDDRARAIFGGNGAQQLRKMLDMLLENIPEIWKINSFFPTMLFRQAKPDKFQQMIENNLIASAKLVGTGESHGLLWQEQLEAIWQGQLARV